MAQGQEVLESVRFLGKDDRHGVAVGGHLEGGVAAARGGLAGGLAIGGTIGNGHPRPRCPGLGL